MAYKRRERQQLHSSESQQQFSQSNHIHPNRGNRMDHPKRNNGVGHPTIFILLRSSI